MPEDNTAGGATPVSPVDEKEEQLRKGRERAKASYDRIRQDPERWVAFLKKSRDRRKTPTGQARDKRTVERRKKRRQSDPDYRREVYNRETLWAYGISQSEAGEFLLIEQGGRCAICQCTDGSWVIDHCKETGKLRGILCGGCNKGIGLLRHSQDALHRAVQYLETPPIQQHSELKTRRARLTGRRRKT